MAQFRCEMCNEGFEQRSRYERHMASSHPPRAPSAADLERALAGIEFPVQRRDLLKHASRRTPADAAVLQLMRGLPERTYRDAADVAVALGEIKRPGRVRSAAEVSRTEALGRKGGRIAATQAVSAAAVAKILSGIEFPKTKSQIRNYARRHREKVAASEGVVAVIDRLPNRRYTNMADVELEIGKIL